MRLHDDGYDSFGPHRILEYAWPTAAQLRVPSRIIRIVQMVAQGLLRSLSTPRCAQENLSVDQVEADAQAFLHPMRTASLWHIPLCILS